MDIALLLHALAIKYIDKSAKSNFRFVIIPKGNSRDPDFISKIACSC